MSGSEFVRTAEALAAAGRVPEALLMLNKAASAGDGDALFTLGMWRMTGLSIPRDLRLSRDYFRKASEAGQPNSQAIYTALVANGTGAPSNWAGALRLLSARQSRDAGAKRQVSLIQKMELNAEGNPADVPKGELLSASPRVVSFRRLLTQEECDYLASAAASLFQSSDVIHPLTRQRIKHPVRTSDFAAFPFIYEDPVIHAINRRIAAVSNTNVEQGEPLQVLRYKPGQEYKPHHDALPGEGNQREVTVLVYLNDGYTGGETFFSTTGLSVRGKVGDALMFRNVTEDGRPDPMAQHAGHPVLKGTKLIASRWIRREPLDLGAPRY